MDSGQKSIQAAAGAVPEAGRRIRGISGSTIKIIAVAAMLIDHAAAVVLIRYLRAGRAAGDLERQELLYAIYDIMRDIGRLGFPIFCFLLVEGYQRTKDVKKYALRLGLFALLSDVPFDLAICGPVFHLGYQNVYFTLLLGLLALWACRLFERCRWRVLTVCGDVAALALCMAAADFLCTDYGGMGVLTIAVMYFFRRHRVLAMGAGCAVLTVMAFNELPAFVAMLPIALYNGKRGLRMKYFFYAFYPVHLFLLYLIAVLLGLGGVRLM